MATHVTLHPQHPQPYQVQKLVTALQEGAVILYPTDTVYAIGCDLHSRPAVSRVRQIKRDASGKPLTFLCPSLATIARYAQVSDANYRVMRRLVPGPYTFILPATKLVPRLVQDPKRKTTGLRVPDHPLCQALLEGLGNPLISTSVPGYDEGPAGRWGERWANQVDFILEVDTEPVQQVSTILDLTGDTPVVTRQGQGWEAVADWLPLHS